MSLLSARTSARRTAGTLGAALLASVVGLQLVPAQAATPAVAKSFFDASGFIYKGAGCPAHTTPNTSQALAADGAWHTTSRSASGRYAGASWSRSVTTKARVTRNARGQVRLDLRATATSRTDPDAGGATCGFNDEVEGVARLEATVPVRSWLVIRSKTVSKSGSGPIAQAHGRAGAGNYPGPFGFDTTLDKGTQTRLAAPDTYAVYVGGGVRTGASVGTTRTSTMTATVDSMVAFYPVGTLRTKSGTGLPFLKPGHRDCANRRVKVAFTSAVRTRARSITFTVDGQRRLTLTGRQVDRAAVQLKDIGPRRDGLVRADIVLKNGARKVMRATSWPCA